MPALHYNLPMPADGKRKGVHEDNGGESRLTKSPKADWRIAQKVWCIMGLRKIGAPAATCLFSVQRIAQNCTDPFGTTIEFSAQCLNASSCLLHVSGASSGLADACGNGVRAGEHYMDSD